MRAQQAVALNSDGYLPPDHFDQIFSSHGTIMIFFMAMPFMSGLMNIVVPQQIGTRDVAFPFLPEGMVEVRGKIAQVLGGFLVPDRRHLYVVGTTQPRYGLGPLVRPAAVLLAEWIALQDELEVPLANVLQAMGSKPPTSHLVDPHRALHLLKVARRMTPAIRWWGQVTAPRSAPPACTPSRPPTPSRGTPTAERPL